MFMFLMRGELNRIQRQKNTSSLGIFCNRKGMQVSRDVVFDEMDYWYGPTKVTKDANARNGNAAITVEQQTQSLGGPNESSNSGSNAWIRRL